MLIPVPVPEATSPTTAPVPETTPPTTVPVPEATPPTAVPVPAATPPIASPNPEPTPPIVYPVPVATPPTTAVYGHYGGMAIVAIEAIVHPGHQYGCQKKRLDLRIGASEANFA